QLRTYGGVVEHRAEDAPKPCRPIIGKEGDRLAIVAVHGEQELAPLAKRRDRDQAVFADDDRLKRLLNQPPGHAVAVVAEKELRLAFEHRLLTSLEAVRNKVAR